MVEFDATIFDRWGEAIYQWNNVEGGWDGRTKNEPEVQNDVYVLKMNAKGFCNTKKSYLETITVIK